MFSFGSVRRVYTRSVFALLVVSFLSATLFFTGCKTDSDDPGALNGTWSSYDSYVINTSTNKIEYVGNYKADIVNSPKYDAATGVLIIRFTWYLETIYDWNPPYDSVSQTEREDYNGKFGAVYWKDLTAGSVQMADAYDTATWGHAMYDTIEEAKTNFTIDRTADYVSMWGTYSK
ncbi:MAG: hypothetical protein FWC24_02690 [Treponema sp.]|nr:hypothetical protein [Treponema sp.]